MNKEIYKSKTVWGFGVAVLIALGGVIGIDFATTTVAQAIQILAGALGLYGLRDALQ